MNSPKFSLSCFYWVAAPSVFALMPYAHSAVLIDDFNNTGNDGSPIGLFTTTGSTDSQTQTSPLIGSISGNRVALLDEVFGVDGAAIADQINADTVDGYVSFSAAQLFSEADLEFSYDGLGGIDLTDGGTNDAFELFVRSESSFGFGEVTWAVGVEDTSNNFDITSDSNISEGFNRINFATGIVDYTSVQEILLYVNAFSIASVESVQFDNFQAVPEPEAFAAILAVVMIGFAGFNRRGRK